MSVRLIRQRLAGAERQAWEQSWTKSLGVEYNARVSCYVLPNFYAGAEAMRRAFDGHFADTDHHGAGTHQIWNYWHVPRLYTYLRTQPEKVIPEPLVTGLLGAIRDWSAENLGFELISPPYLSLYVDGCGQGLHNDAGNGRFGYVYSLTRWDQRSFRGGETTLFRREPYWGEIRSARPAAGSALYDLVEPRFNQLLIFDDRMIHGVERLEGNMDPREGRVVLHGHIRNGDILVRGALGREEVRPEIERGRALLPRQLGPWASLAVGVLSCRLSVAGSGKVESVAVLCEQISGISDELSRVSVRDQVVRTLSELTFPARPSGTSITVPVVLG